MAQEFTTSKASDAPLRTVVTPADTILIVGDGAPPDVYQASIETLAVLTADYVDPGPVGPTGPQGPSGPQGVGLTIDGTALDFADLNANAPKVENEVYVTTADGKLWVCDGVAWSEIATALGPTGPQGPAGAQGIQGATGPAGPTGVAGAPGASVPTGTLLPWAGTAATVPAGFELCDVDQFRDPSNPKYAPLFAVIGYAYGQGSGNLFQLPNINGRTLVGVNPLDPLFTIPGRPSGSRDAVVVDHEHSVGSLSVAAHRHPIGGSTGDDTPDHAHGMQHTHPGISPNTDSGFFSRNVHVVGNSWTPNPSPEVAGGAWVNPPTGPADRGGTDNANARHRHGLPAETADQSAGITGVAGRAGESKLGKNIQPSLAIYYIIKL